MAGRGLSDVRLFSLYIVSGLLMTYFLTPNVHSVMIPPAETPRLSPTISVLSAISKREELSHREHGKYLGCDRNCEVIFELKIPAGIRAAVRSPFPFCSYALTVEDEIGREVVRAHSDRCPFPSPFILNSEQ
ncbi:MAG: hypothetical protein AAB691_01140 [Patescibacteria group bacterium]